MSRPEAETDRTDLGNSSELCSGIYSARYPEHGKALLLESMMVFFIQVSNCGGCEFDQLSDRHSTILAACFFGRVFVQVCSFINSIKY